MDLANERVLLTGGSGFIGTNLQTALRLAGVPFVAPTRREFDLTSQYDVRRMFAGMTPWPTVVIHLAGLVGGIEANRRRPAEFFAQNLLMTTMVMHESRNAGSIKKFLALVGACSYPADAERVFPEKAIPESALLSGYPQAESASFGLAKAMTVVQAQAYRRQYGFPAIVLIPGNVYGPHDNFDLDTGHVVPAMIRRFVEARARGAASVSLWGSGRPIRDFVFVDDVCRAIIRAVATYDSSEPINVSSGEGTTIRELAELIGTLVEYRGDIEWDETKPDGQAVKILDVRRMRDVLRFEPGVSLREGLRLTVDWFREHRHA